MRKTRIVADGVPEPPANTFSNAIVVDRAIYVSGQTAGLADGTIAGENDVRTQASQAFDNIRRLLEAAGATMADVVKLTVYLTDMSTRAQFSEARRGFFSGDFPCSTLVEVSALAQPGFLVEIEAIAVRNSE